MSWGKQGSCGSSKGALELNDEQCWSKQTKSETEKKENRVCEKRFHQLDPRIKMNYKTISDIFGLLKI